MISDRSAEMLWAHRVSGAQYLRAMRVIHDAPPILQEVLADRYQRIAGASRYFYPLDGRMHDTYNDADVDLRKMGKQLNTVKPQIAFDDDAIETLSDRSARHCVSSTFEEACNYAERQQVALPTGKRVTAKSLKRRLTSHDWWRRKLRTLLTRRCEELFRRLGFVRKQTSAYVSGDALQRIRVAARKCQHWIEETSAVCEDTGEVMPLSDITEHSLSNPALRRGELMLRARGFQEIAELCLHRCLMVTLTCPSAFHPWKHTGEANSLYAGGSPRDGQRWLNIHWARVRATLKSREILVYGFRAAEPHHDGTPHWHMVLYAPANQIEPIREVIERVWLKDYGDEPGAQQRRVKFMEEDPAKGTGAGYLAKYVAKNIDGHGDIGAETSDESGNPIADDCQRAIAWARLHGIRQFQQVGGPSVTLWRELRRVRKPCDCPPLEALRLTTEGSGEAGASWSQFISQLGGIDGCLKTSRGMLDKAEPRCRDTMGRTVFRLTRWGELPAMMVIGVRLVWRDRIRRLATRVHIWVLVFSPLGPVAITVGVYGAPSTWTNPQETSQAPPFRCTDPACPVCRLEKTDEN